MSSLPSLIERLEKCDAPDREIDADLERSLFPAHEIRLADIYWRVKRDPLGPFDELPLYTASLDDVVALCERKHPDALFGLIGHGMVLAAEAGCFAGKDLARFVLLALLRALHKKGQDDER